MSHMNEVTDELVTAVIEAVNDHSPYMYYDAETAWCDCKPYFPGMRGGTLKRDAILWTPEHQREMVRAAMTGEDPS